VGARGNIAASKCNCLFSRQYTNSPSIPSFRFPMENIPNLPAPFTSYQTWLIAIIFGVGAGILYFLTIKKIGDDSDESHKTWKIQYSVIAAILVSLVSLASVFLSPISSGASLENMPVISGVNPPF